MITLGVIYHTIVNTIYLLHLPDIFDILFISFLIYTLFLLFRRARTYLGFWGIGIALILYIISRQFHLYLTYMTLRYFAGISAILIAIIFQGEIRKYIEVLGLIASRQFLGVKFKQKTSPITPEIVQACVQMAQAKTGALIVLQAENNISSVVEGGIPLDSLISEEILISIFDTHSAGHDGAVVISKNRIMAFGVHLPLSTNFKEIGKHGTRHSAAVGLSELTDALCIVCSEEKGTISIAKDGKLKTLTDFDRLEKEINKHLTAQNPQLESFLTHFIKHNTILKIVALLLSTIIWFFVAYQR